MKKLFLLFALLGLFSLSSCGSTENCRTRTSAYKFQKSQAEKIIVSNEITDIIK